MSPDRILEIANRPDVPKFVFGSLELDAWTREHRDSYSGECAKTSDWYVVIHRSLDPCVRPDFRVLSCWSVGQRVPLSFDVPAGV